MKMVKTNRLTYKGIFILTNDVIKMIKVLIGIPVKLQKVGKHGQ